MTYLLLFNQGPPGDMYYVYLIFIVALIVLSPVIICTSIGFYLRRKKPKTAKTLFIITGVYLLIGLGLCSGLTIPF